MIRQNPAAEAHGQHMQEMGPEPGSNKGALWLQTKKAVGSMLAEVAKQSPERGGRRSKPSGEGPGLSRDRMSRGAFESPETM